MVTTLILIMLILISLMSLMLYSLMGDIKEQIQELSAKIGRLK